MEEMKVANQKIRIRLKGYDHEIVDQSTKLIVDTASSKARTSIKTLASSLRCAPTSA